MVEPLSTILYGASLAARVGGLLNLFGSSNVKIGRLMQADLNAAMRHLESAKNADSEIEQKCQLRDGRLCFQRAADMDKGKKAVALLGLASCQQWLGETTNSRRALEEILSIGPVVDFTNVIWKFTKMQAQQPTLLFGRIIGVDTKDVDSAFLKASLFEAINEHEDGKSTLGIQFLVSEHLNKSVPWVCDLSPEYYSLIKSIMCACART